MSLLRELFGPSQEEVWATLAQSVGGQFSPGGWLSVDTVQAVCGDWLVTLDTIHERKRTYTRVRAPFLNRDGFRFTVYRAGFFTELAKLLGTQDLELGYPFFDPEFVIQSNDPQKVGDLLANERIRRLIQLQPQVYFTIEDSEGWFGPTFPEGVDELQFKVEGLIKDLDQLRGLYDLFAEVLNHLGHLDSGSREDMTLHLEALGGPGGKLRSGEVLLWDGDLPRIRAARALRGVQDFRVTEALLRALPTADGELKLELIRCLGESQDSRAVPALLPYLGDVQRVPTQGFGWGSFREAAGLALKQLGQERTAAAFGAVVRGETERLSELDPTWRSTFVLALCGTLHSESLAEVAGAARALAAWGAVEALPDLRGALRRVRRSGKDAAAVDEAIRDLERHTALPRPSLAPAPTPEDLPLPSDSAGDRGGQSKAG